MGWLQGRAPELQDAIAERAELGLKRYGMYLQPNNGRCAITDCIQESLDKLNYLAQEWVEASISNNPFEKEIMEDFWDEVEKISRLCKRLEWKWANEQTNG